ncbi:uncharacterized protein BDZ99DRAFT_105149 [Mytilinidion resinicola]|uniref:Uncharacterized protein n=1 Tax=Mytilinidion resinicola TaxID=574789 RepID=A0A6A6YC47_9PEZI|nr:uncharacterized protein BDZ99DRAFT_105149 [Mytilinidion resinicola]KAF2805417.1 hypothetical protein BDZ99DRAFT_105149 [Mytilinidion resinicola]
MILSHLCRHVVGTSRGQTMASTMVALCVTLECYFILDIRAIVYSVFDYARCQRSRFIA